MGQELDNDEIVIDLAELFSKLMSKIHMILLSGILMASLAFAGTKMLITPMYTSVTKIYVSAKQDGSGGTTYSDLQAGTQLTKDYMELIKSRPVLERVISVLQLKQGPDELSDRITVEIPEETRILKISVESDSPKEAKQIADALRVAVSAQIKEIMDVDAVNTVEDGSLPASPSSPSLKKNSVLGGLLGIILAVGIIFLRFMLDDTIKTPDDVEKYLGLHVLASLPIQEGMKKSKKVKSSSEKKTMKKMKR